ncbi:MAG TPA: hypothetical protein VF898_12395 [Chloroflexota bacterium]
MFFTDFQYALNTWRRSPWLPLTSAVLIVLADLPSAAGHTAWFWILPSLPFAVFGVGYVGTERLWYRRAWNVQGMTPEDVWRASWGYFGRYVRLGLIGLVGIAVIELPVLVISHASWTSPIFSILLVVLAVVLDVLATFVTPALAYTTRSAFRAISIGLSTVRQTWPESALYVLCPPLALAVLLRLFNPEHGLPLLAQDTSTTLLNLAFKGAVAAYYLRLAIPAEDKAIPLTK